MASSLPTSRYQFENDLRALRKAIGWQSPGYDSKMRHGMLSLTQPSNFVYSSVPSILIGQSAGGRSGCWCKQMPTSS
jgi:hypothetical protein